MPVPFDCRLLEAFKMNGMRLAYLSKRFGWRASQKGGLWLPQLPVSTVRLLLKELIPSLFVWSCLLLPFRHVLPALWRFPIAFDNNEFYTKTSLYNFFTLVTLKRYNFHKRYVNDLAVHSSIQEELHVRVKLFCLFLLTSSDWRVVIIKRFWGLSLIRVKNNSVGLKRGHCLTSLVKS